jgi:predicted Rossmann fold nucleotide-binding protein DprA/Smf involved in DNA uptake
MKIAIVGSRRFDDYNLLKSIMDAHLPIVTLIISGGAKGADQLAERWSNEFLKNSPKIIRPNWKDISHDDAIIKSDDKGNMYDARAGLRRNELIAQQADLVIAFWDGQSKGTKQIILYAQQIDKEVQIVKYKEAAQLKFPF